MPRLLIYVPVVVVGGYLVVTAILYALQPHLMYVPAREMVSTPAAYGMRYEAIGFSSADGVLLSGWWVAVPDARGTVLFCHGNGGNISHLVDRIGLFNGLGLNTFVFDYRGYGESEGSPSEEGTYLDAAAAWDVVVEQKEIDPENIVVYGWSMGGAIAAQLVASRGRGEQAGKLVLESAFTSIPDLGEELYPLFPARRLARFGYDTQRYLEQSDCPVLIVHSVEDELISITHGRRLFETVGARGRMLETRGTHASGYSESSAAYRAALEEFITGS